MDGWPVTRIQGDALLTLLHNRRDVIECLTREPHSKPELVDACGVSRSTVDRALGTLSESGILVRGEKSRYELTVFGAIVVREFERFHERLDNLAEVRDYLPGTESPLGLEPDLFDDAVISPTDGIGTTAALDAFEDATSLRLIDPPFTLVYLALMSDAQPFSDVDLTLLLNVEMVAEVSATDPRLLEEPERTGVEIGVIPDSLPFSVVLADRPTGRALFLVLRNRNEGSVLVEMTAPAALAWGDGLYERVRP